MADPARRLAHNAPGEFFVDATCIDCDTCRWMAPRTFTEREDQASVHAQPAGEADVALALKALVSCPTGSIGAGPGRDAASAAASFPDEIAPGVFHCGFHSRKSFGAASYLIVRPQGNVLVDSPRWVGGLVERIAAMGGVRTMFLTHQDDVAEHERFRERFGCERVLHEADVGADTEGVERKLAGDAPVRLADDLVAIPTPGHTAGSACLLWKDEFLFTGDHLAWSERLRNLYAFRDACWMDWGVQTESMRKLLGFEFSWVLPGHGRRCSFPKDEMRRRLERCVAWMEGAAVRT